MNTVKIMEKLMTYVNNQTTEWECEDHDDNVDGC
jgi:hypothetical protein